MKNARLNSSARRFSAQARTLLNTSIIDTENLSILYPCFCKADYLPSLVPSGLAIFMKPQNQGVFHIIYNLLITHNKTDTDCGLRYENGY